MKEDDLLRRLINEMYGSDDNLYPEARYNNYGTRGVVDLYADTATSDHVYEFKSESAVRDVTGANEITRQFNKHCENFFKGSSFDRQERWTTFELCFLPTPITAAHVIDNSTIYKQCIQNARVGSGDARLTFRHPEDHLPIVLIASNTDYLNEDDDLLPMCLEANNLHIWREIKDIVKDRFPDKFFD